MEDLSNTNRLGKTFQGESDSYRLIFENSPEIIFLLNLDGVIIECNELAQKYCSQSRDVLIGENFHDICLSKKYKIDLLDIIRRLREGEVIQSIVVEVLTPESQSEWIEMFPSLIQKSENSKYIYISIRDVTEQNRAIESKIENEEKYRTVIESANDAIFLINKLVFIDCNARTLQIFSCNREQVLSHSVVDLSPEYQPDGQLSKVKAKEKSDSALSGKPQFFEWKHQNIDGTLFDAEVSLNRVYLKGDCCLLAIIRDISERKNAEQKIIESEDRFNIISKSSNDVIWIRDLNLRYKYVSPSCYKILGYSVEEIMELNVNQITTPEYVEQITKLLKEELALEGQPNVDPTRTRILEILEIKKDGSRIWTETQASITRDKEGKITGILGVTRDINERKLFEDALQESEERFRITAEKTGEIIFEYDITSGHIIWSGAIETITGYKLEDFKDIGVDKWSDLIHPDERQNAIDELERAIVNNTDYFIEYRFRRKDDLYIYLEVRGILMPGMQRMFGSMNDITARKRAQAEVQENEKRLKEQNEEYLALNEELLESNQQIAEINDELTKARDKAEENDRLKSAFLANMSHEIRTPMNGLIGFSELIIQPNTTDESRKQYAEIINNSCNQLLSIVNDIIDISRIETNQVTINENKLALYPLLSNIGLFFQPQAETKNIQLNFLNDSSVDDIEIIIDEVKLNQIITNLINNALKFTHDGKVEFGYSIKDEFIEFFVSDTGIGIDSKHFDSIFDRFRQVDVGITRNYGGTGLGLSISKAFIEKMGGKIWLQSKPSLGTTFFFTIPFRPIIVKDKIKTSMAEKQFTLFNTNILVAEDEDVNYMYIKILLESLGLSVIRAENGQQAIDIYRSTPNIDIILMDIKMPIMDGVTATRRIKSINKDIPIIATTAYALSGEREEFLEAGCNDYISKPIRPADLISVIKNYIKH